MVTCVDNFITFYLQRILKNKDIILNNLPLLFFLALTSVGLFNSFTYLALVHTQVINASLFNTAIPAMIIFLCFLLKIEKTNKFQIFGLIISVLGILSIITKLDLNILLSLNFNKGDLIMIGGSNYLGLIFFFFKKKKFTLPLLTLVHVLCTFGLIFILPQFLYELSQGLKLNLISTWSTLLFI